MVDLNQRCPNARGKKLGSGRSLSAEQERVIRMTIIDKRPEQIMNRPGNRGGCLV